MKREKQVYNIQDSERTGSYGIVADYAAEYFDPFWDGAMGVFHDVFEHYFELSDKYIKTTPFTVVGEIVAMGHMVYYCNDMGLVRKRLPVRYVQPEQAGARSISSLLWDIFVDDYAEYALGNLNAIPEQKTGSVNIEYAISEMFSTIEREVFEEANKLETQKELKTITFDAIANLLRYGYNLASKRIPDTGYNHNVLVGFIDFWEDFCKRTDAEEISAYYDKINFHLKTNTKEVSWRATIRDSYTRKEMNILNFEKMRL